MSRRRFFAAPEAFNKQSVTLATDEAKHLREVLRLKPGDEVLVFDGDGREFRCTVASARRDEAFLDQCEEIAPSRPESPLNLTLAVALLKGEKFDLVVQKTTELGVMRIVPVETRYADIRLRDHADTERRVNRWRRIALEAAKQCGRAKIPEISEPVEFQFLIANEKASTRLMFSERDGASLAEALPTSTIPEGLVALVGSEGGWSDEELSAARYAGWQIVTLGGRVLRAETAAIAVAVMLEHSFGDLR